MRPRPPISTLFPYTTLFRSGRAGHRVVTAPPRDLGERRARARRQRPEEGGGDHGRAGQRGLQRADEQDRKSTRLNSSHSSISYAVFCLKKKKNKENNVK